MAKLTITTGDATEPTITQGKMAYLPHCCNDIGGWGKGFVNAITDRWGEIPRAAYKHWSLGTSTSEVNQHLRDRGFNNKIYVASQTPFQLGAIQLTRLNESLMLVNMVGQHKVGFDENGKPPIRYGALAQAMFNLKCNIAPMDHGLVGAEIHCPRFGSGLSGGDASVIEALIQELWVDNGIDTIIYDFPENK